MPSTAPIKVPILGQDKYTKVFNDMTKKAMKIGGAVKSVGKTMTRTMTLPVIGLGAVSLKMSRDMNKAMANVGTLIPGQTERLKKLKKEVMDLGVETGTSSTVIAEGLYETISAFGGAEDPVNKLTIATKMSRAGLASVKESLSLVSAVTKGYGDTSDEAAQKASDLAFMTVKLGQTTFPDLAASMGRVVPLAANLNIKQEELFGGFATLTGVTGNAAEVSTQLSAVLAAMMKPTSALTKTVKKMGFASATAMVKEIGLEQSLQRLNVAVDGDSDKMAKLLTRKEALVAAMALTGGQAKVFTQKIKDMGGAAGATEEAFKAQTEGIDKQGFKWDQFTQRLQKLAIRIGDKLFPVIEKILTKLEPFIDMLLSASDETWELWLKIGGVVAAAGPLLTMVGSLTTAVGGFVRILGPGSGLGGAFMKLIGPLGGTQSMMEQTLAGTKGLTAEMREAIGMSGQIKAPQTMMGKVGGFLGKAGAVGAAGYAGWEIGSFINKAFFEPQNQMVADLMMKAETFSSGAAQSADEITQSLKDIDALAKKLDMQYGGTEVLAGQILGTFTDIEKPAERFGRALENLNEETQKLYDKQVSLMEKKVAEAEASVGATEQEMKEWGADPLVQKYLREIAEREKTGGELTVKFENMPPGMNPQVKNEKGGGVKVEKKDAVMRGPI